MHRNRCLLGGPRVGSTTKTHAAGFSGIVAIFSAGGVRTTSVKSGAGAPCGGILPKSRSTVGRAIWPVAHGSDRRCSIGRMIRGSCKALTYVNDQYGITLRLGYG